MSSNCPNGGFCADPCIPSHCELNNGCIFSTSLEKKQFDDLPDLYQVRTKNGDFLKFKNRNQLDSYLNFFGGNEVLID